MTNITIICSIHTHTKQRVCTTIIHSETIVKNISITVTIPDLIADLGKGLRPGAKLQIMPPKKRPQQFHNSLLTLDFSRTVHFSPRLLD